MSALATTLLLSLLSASGAFAQSSSTVAGTPAATSGSATQALQTTATSTSVDASIITMVAGTGPQGFSIPALSELTSGAATDATVALDTTATVGQTPTAVSGAPALPTSALVVADYPALDVTPPTNSSLIQEWLSKIDLTQAPNYNVTTGECATDATAISDGRCWWTCGGCTRETDITECPDKYTWGLSYDDGPSPYTPLLLDYLDEVNVTTTFFIVGSRALSRPQMVQSEYIRGHQLSVHTWSHPYLTTLTNEQVIAELAWTMKVIKDATGVTPNTFRPPYGDIDDRVRWIAAQMGLTPIIWTSITANGTTTNFDTNDWHIPGGTATGASSLETFDTILNTYVPQLDTGFIVLEHDLYQQTVDLAVGYVLPQAIASGKFQLKSIISCLGRPLSEAYIETSSNTTATTISSASGGSTFFQASVGSATGSAVTATGTASGSSGTTTTAASGGSDDSKSSGTTSGSSSSSTSSSAKSAAFRGAEFNVVPAIMALGAIACGMILVA